MAYISCNTWLYSELEPVRIDIKKITDRFIVDFSIGYGKVEIQFTREDLKTLRDKIDNILLDE